MGKSEYIIIIIIFTFVLLTFIVGTVAYIIQYRKKKLEHTTETAMLNEQHIQELLSTQLEIQTQTMQYIGREIHDNVGQKLTLASLYTQKLAYENKAPQIKDAIENISHIINESLSDLRQLSKSLTDDAIEHTDIVSLIKQECDRINNLQQCKVLFQSNQQNINLPYQTKSILLRIAQEFLQNSIKHAKCKTIEVILNNNNNQLQLLLKDDGIGFNNESILSNGIGFKNIKKRITIIGGTQQLNTSLGKGTELTIEIPIPLNK